MAAQPAPGRPRPISVHSVDSDDDDIVCIGESGPAAGPLQPAVVAAPGPDATVDAPLGAGPVPASINEDAMDQDEDTSWLDLDNPEEDARRGLNNALLFAETRFYLVSRGCACTFMAKLIENSSGIIVGSIAEAEVCIFPPEDQWTRNMEELADFATQQTRTAVITEDWLLACFKAGAEVKTAPYQINRPRPRPRPSREASQRRGSSTSATSPLSPSARSSSSALPDLQQLQIMEQLVERPVEPLEGPVENPAERLAEAKQEAVVMDVGMDGIEEEGHVSDADEAAHASGNTSANTSSRMSGPATTNVSDNASEYLPRDTPSCSSSTASPDVEMDVDDADRESSDDIPLALSRRKKKKPVLSSGDSSDEVPATSKNGTKPVKKKPLVKRKTTARVRSPEQSSSSLTPSSSPSPSVSPSASASPTSAAARAAALNGHVTRSKSQTMSLAAEPTRTLAPRNVPANGAEENGSSTTQPGGINGTSSVVGHTSQVQIATTTKTATTTLHARENQTGSSNVTAATVASPSPTSGVSPPPSAIAPFTHSSAHGSPSTATSANGAPSTLPSTTDGRDAVGGSAPGASSAAQPRLPPPSSNYVPRNKTLDVKSLPKIQRITAPATATPVASSLAAVVDGPSQEMAPRPRPLEFDNNDTAPKRRRSESDHTLGVGGCTPRATDGNRTPRPGGRTPLPGNVTPVLGSGVPRRSEARPTRPPLVRMGHSFNDRFPNGRRDDATFNFGPATSHQPQPEPSHYEASRDPRLGGGQRGPPPAAVPRRPPSPVAPFSAPALSPQFSSNLPKRPTVRNQIFAQYQPEYTGTGPGRPTRPSTQAEDMRPSACDRPSTAATEMRQRLNRR